MAMTSLYLATEDELSEAVGERLVLEANSGLHVAVRLGRRGNGYLRRKFPELMRTAQSIPILLLTDLDRVACPPKLLADWRGELNLPPNMLFRVAVREVEAWLLADRQGFAEFCGAPPEKIPLTPESLNDPKQSLLNLVRRYSSRDLKNDILPGPGSSAKVGLAYNHALREFIAKTWSVARAAEHAESLRRTYQRLRELSVCK